MNNFLKFFIHKILAFILKCILRIKIYHTLFHLLFFIQNYNFS